MAGGRFEEVRARMDAFIAEWGGSEFGPAHIILSDDNLEDYWIDKCLIELETNRRPEWMDAAQWPAEDERHATIALLRELKAIPEDERCPDDGESCDEDAAAAAGEESGD